MEGIFYLAVYYVVMFLAEDFLGHHWPSQPD